MSVFELEIVVKNKTILFLINFYLLHVCTIIRTVIQQPSLIFKTIKGNYNYDLKNIEIDYTVAQLQNH